MPTRTSNGIPLQNCQPLPRSTLAKSFDLPPALTLGEMVSAATSAYWQHTRSELTTKHTHSRIIRHFLSHGSQKLTAVKDFGAPRIVSQIPSREREKDRAEQSRARDTERQRRRYPRNTVHIQTSQAAGIIRPEVRATPALARGGRPAAAFSIPADSRLYFTTKHWLSGLDSTTGRSSLSSACTRTFRSTHSRFVMHRGFPFVARPVSVLRVASRTKNYT